MLCLGQKFPAYALTGVVSAISQAVDIGAALLHFRQTSRLAPFGLGVWRRWLAAG